MTDTPTGEFKQQTNKNNGETEQTKAADRTVEEEIKVVVRDLETAKSERRGTGVTPFWVSIQGNQLRLDTVTQERDRIERKKTIKTIERNKGSNIQVKVSTKTGGIRKEKS